jgi:hypothetical protein
MLSPEAEGHGHLLPQDVGRGERNTVHANVHLVESECRVHESLIGAMAGYICRPDDEPDGCSTSFHSNESRSVARVNQTPASTGTRYHSVQHFTQFLERVGFG